VRTGLRQSRAAHHSRRQFGAVANQSGGRLGGAQAYATVQSDSAAQNQIVRRRAPQVQQPRHCRSGSNAVARENDIPHGRPQRATPELLAPGGNGHEKPQQLGA